eukprot:7409720-Pyramimonas_sp.AAC.1
MCSCASAGGPQFLVLDGCNRGVRIYKGGREEGLMLEFIGAERACFYAPARKDCIAELPEGESEAGARGRLPKSVHVARGGAGIVARTLRDRRGVTAPRHHRVHPCTEWEETC